jgi:hypothetical protein
MVTAIPERSLRVFLENVVCDMRLAFGVESVLDVETCEEVYRYQPSELTGQLCKVSLGNSLSFLCEIKELTCTGTSAPTPAEDIVVDVCLPLPVHSTVRVQESLGPELVDVVIEYLSVAEETVNVPDDHCTYKETRMQMRSTLAGRRVSRLTLGNECPFVAIVLRGNVGDTHWRGRVVTVCFGQQSVDIWDLLPVVIRRQARRLHVCVDGSLGLALDFRVEGKEKHKRQGRDVSLAVG